MKSLWTVQCHFQHAVLYDWNAQVSVQTAKALSVGWCSLATGIHSLHEWVNMECRTNSINAKLSCGWRPFREPWPRIEKCGLHVVSMLKPTEPVITFRLIFVDQSWLQSHIRVTATTPILLSPHRYYSTQGCRGIHLGSRNGKAIGSGTEPLALIGAVGKLCADGADSCLVSSLAAPVRSRGRWYVSQWRESLLEVSMGLCQALGVGERERERPVYTTASWIMRKEFAPSPHSISPHPFLGLFPPSGLQHARAFALCSTSCGSLFSYLVCS